MWKENESLTCLFIFLGENGKTKTSTSSTTDSPEDSGPFGHSWNVFMALLDDYPAEFSSWLTKYFVPSTMKSCRPRQMKKFRRLSKWCRSLVRSGKCSFGMKCNFCHHFSEF